MTPNVIILAAAAIGLVVNTLVILGIAWRGGHLLGKMEGTMERLTEGVERLAREVEQLSDGHHELAERVSRIEGPSRGGAR